MRAFAAVAMIVLLAGGCTDEETPPVGPGAGGIVALAITPSSAEIDVPPAGTVTAAFEASATLAGGGTRDVTGEATWKTDLPGAQVVRGTLVVNRPGRGQVIAMAGDRRAVAGVVARARGEVLLDGAPPGVKDPFAGGGAPASQLDIAYPLDGAIFPANLGDTEIHVAKSDPSQSLARIHVEGDLIAVDLYGACDGIPGAANACLLRIPRAVVPALAGASEGERMGLSVRLAAPDGSAIGESVAIDVRWAELAVGGGLYYWSARHNGPTRIMRIDLDAEDASPEPYWQNADSPALHDGTAMPCMGCHAISQDGEKLALTFGGSDASDFALVEVATRRTIAVRNMDASGFATFSAFSPDGARIVTSLRGRLSLRAADQTLAEIAVVEPIEAGGEALTQPFWSGDGRLLAFTAWAPGEHGASASRNGDVERGARVFVAEMAGDAAGPTREVVPRVAGASSYYPAISDDSAWLAFNRSRCDGPASRRGYGDDPCDGYDDASARVFVVGAAGGDAVDLARLNGSETWTTSWPRWSPSHGTFRGKQLHFVTFSSRRPYGLRLPGSTDGSTPPQIWIAGVLLDPEAPLSAGEDPSFAPIWLPRQNEQPADPTGNHVPQWVRRAVPIEL